MIGAPPHDVDGRRVAGRQRLLIDHDREHAFTIQLLLGNHHVAGGHVGQPVLLADQVVLGIAQFERQLRLLPERHHLVD
ncbi:hypothetical protein WM04_09715 [Burkholderia ubonensis]|nr:hypothetical protein WM04_09715 [Burkholderia ubonensis]OJB15956.1 hypothetical protein BGV53_19050 [Burkholderia ubonensis]